MSIMHNPRLVAVDMLPALYLLLWIRDGVCAWSYQGRERKEGPTKYMKDMGGCLIKSGSSKYSNTNEQKKVKRTVAFGLYRRGYIKSACSIVQYACSN
jgi:hypothetical protein